MYWSEWVVDPFAPKFCPLIQNNIGPTFGNGLNFVTRKHSFRVLHRGEKPLTRIETRITLTGHKKNHHELSETIGERQKARKERLERVNIFTHTRGKQKDSKDSRAIASNHSFLRTLQYFAVLTNPDFYHNLKIFQMQKVHVAPSLLTVLNLRKHFNKKALLFFKLFCHSRLCIKFYVFFQVKWLSFSGLFFGFCLRLFSLLHLKILFQTAIYGTSMSTRVTFTFDLSLGILFTTVFGYCRSWCKRYRLGNMSLNGPRRHGNFAGTLG